MLPPDVEKLLTFGIKYMLLLGIKHQKPNRGSSSALGDVDEKGLNVGEKHSRKHDLV